MKRVGIVGWRGMVGSVLMQRMHAERDFALIEPVFFSTSQAGALGPFIGKESAPLKDARNVKELSAMDIVVSCQGRKVRKFEGCSIAYAKKKHPHR